MHRLQQRPRADWTEFSGNPVVRHQGATRGCSARPTKRWVMAVYDELDGKTLDRLLHFT